MCQPLQCRNGGAADAGCVAALFTASVHGLTESAYTSAQRAAWAPQPPDLQVWAARLSALTVRLAVADGQLLGFIGYTVQGHIDLLFTAPSQARRGVAQQLYRDAEAALRAGGVRRLTADASLVATPFFRRQGFVIERAEIVVRGGIPLPRNRMYKTL